MIKVTLPNGIIVEGDSSIEVVNVIDLMHADLDDAPVAPVTTLKPVVEPEPEPKLPSSPNYPHRLSETNCGIKIGAREEQILRAAKMIAEVNESRATEFTTAEVADLCGVESAKVSSALFGLAGKGIVAHGSHKRVWLVTRKGWDSKYWVIQPIRAGK